MAWEWDREICPVDNSRLVHGNVIPMGIPLITSHGLGLDRHKLLWDGMGMGQINMSHGQPWKSANANVCEATSLKRLKHLLATERHFCSNKNLQIST